MEIAVIVKNLVIIGAVLGVAYASQQPFFGTKAKNYVYSEGAANKNPYIKNVTDWTNNNVISSVSAGVSGGLAQGTAALQNATQSVETQKNNLIQNSTDDTKKFIAQEILKALGVKPEDLVSVAACKAN